MVKSQGHLHTTSYSSSIETVYVVVLLRQRVVENCKFFLRHMHFALLLGVTLAEFHRHFTSQNQSPLAMIQHCLCDAVFSPFDRTPYLKRTERWTQGRAIAHTVLA